MNKQEIKYFAQVKDIENLYYKTIKEFSASFPKPINSEEEKKKFFEALENKKIYNPQFVFEEKKSGLDLIKNLKEIKISQKNDLYGLKKIYKDKIEEKINEIKYHSKWGDPQVTKYVIAAKGKPSYYLVLKAKYFCLNYKKQKVKFKRITPKEVGDSLELEVLRLTGEKVLVEFKNMFNKMNISPSKKKIQINKNEQFRTIDLDRLKVHEIGTHYMRYFNGKKTKIKILKTGTSNYIETEEGLAAYMEEMKGVQTKSQMYIYAGRVIATHYALRRSFYEVYKILRRYGFKDSDAYALTFRAKRNICDTSKHGGFTKDYVYFSGYHKVKKFIRKGGDLKDLFVGKIKIEDVKPLRPLIDKRKYLIKTIFDYNLDETYIRISKK